MFWATSWAIFHKLIRSPWTSRSGEKVEKEAKVEETFSLENGHELFFNTFDQKAPSALLCASRSIICEPNHHHLALKVWTNSPCYEASGLPDDPCTT
jgi:hypothetical protein